MSATRVRQNIDCLSANQLHDLREAYQGLYDLPDSDPRSFATIAGYHGLPTPVYCEHGTPGFLTWHRAYMNAFECALRSIRPNVELPFWDWSSSSTTGIPDACAEETYINRAGDEVPNPLFSGPISAAAGGGATGRGANVNNVSFDAPGAQARNALNASDFTSFQNALNGPHGWVHGLVGGQMGGVDFAGYDPIFYLHHANVDRLWSAWQQSHSDPLPANEANLALVPFNKPCSAAWQIGADVESTSDLGYTYANFCFIVLPPIIWDRLRIARIPPQLLRRISTARLGLRSSRMQQRTMEVRVFVNDPEANEETPTIENPRFAGSFGIFGMRGEMPMNREQRAYDIELDITDTLRAFALEEGGADLKLVAVDTAGRPVDPEEIDLSSIDLTLD